eukprot:SAG31_NODE_3648_length_4028_cov_10.401120_2_plen_82_part_00
MLDALPLYETFLVNLWPMKDRVIPMRMSTIEALNALAEQQLEPDLIVVDADHRYSAVWADIEACLSLFPNSVILGTDYDYA